MLKKAIQFNLISDDYNTAIMTAVGLSNGKTVLEVSSDVADSVINDHPSETDDVILTDLAISYLVNQL